MSIEKLDYEKTPSLIKAFFNQTIVKKLNEIIAYLNGNPISTPDYKEYVALITNTGASDPTVTVLSTTFEGEIVWTRDTVGYYFGTLTGAFPDIDKMFFYLDVTAPVTKEIFWQDANTVVIGTLNAADDYADNLLYKNSLIIRVYN
jgi:hypothetical protein